MHKPFFQGVSKVINTDQPVDVMLRSTGGNTGNLLFSTAVQTVVKASKAAQGFRIDPVQIAEEHDGIILCAANWLHERADHSGLLETLEATDVPIVIVGLGAQSEHEKKIPELKPATKRLIALLSERSHSLSVRGNFTAEVLKAYGVTNVTVTGCPSLLLNAASFVPIQKKAEAPQRIAVHSTRGMNIPGVLHDRNRGNHVTRIVSRQSFAAGLPYIAQNEVPDIQIALGRPSECDDFSGRMTKLERLFQTSDRDCLLDHLSANTKVFFSVTEWVDYLHDFDFVFGTRIHGTIAALLAGIPAALIAIDTRTVELAEAMNIPYFLAEDFRFASSIDFERVWDASSFDRFNAEYGTYVEKFRQFFNANGIQTTLPEKILS